MDGWPRPLKKSYKKSFFNNIIPQWKQKNVILVYINCLFTCNFEQDFAGIGKKSKMKKYTFCLHKCPNFCPADEVAQICVWYLYVSLMIFKIIKDCHEFI